MPKKRIRMKKIEEIHFLQNSIKVSRGESDSIDKVCINDVCAVLKRSLFIKDGTALRKCPSAMILNESQPKEIFADFSEVVKFIRWMASGSKIIESVCRDLLELLQRSKVIPGVKGEAIDKHTEENTMPSEQVIVFEYASNKFTMKMSDGRYMVNATEMARPFEKRPTVWLKLAETVQFRQALVDDGVFRNIESQIITTRGPLGATWLDIHLWVQFAQWLSPAFAAWCSKKFVPLMKDGHVSVGDDPAAGASSHREVRHEAPDLTNHQYLPVPANYEEALTVIETQHSIISKNREFIKQNNHKYRHYEETIELREWFSTTMIANELGVSAIRLNLFLMDEGVQERKREEWVITAQYRHLRDIHIYEWLNHKTKYVNKYKIDSWTPEGREYIIELWKKENG